MRILILFIGLSCFGLNAQKVDLDSLWGVWNDPEEIVSRKCQAMEKIAHSAYLFTQPDSAFYCAQRLLEFAEINREYRFVSIALNIQGISFSLRGNNNKALFYFKAMKVINERIGDQEGVASSMSNIGNVYRMLGENDSSLFYFMAALDIAEQTGNSLGTAGALNNIGLIHLHSCKFDIATDYFLKSLTIKTEHGDKKGIANTLTNIGVIYDELGNYAKALDYFNKSLEIRESIGDISGMAYSLNNIGLIYQDEGDLENALKYFIRSLKMREGIGDKSDLSIPLNNIGNLYNSQGDYQSAMDYHLRSLNNSKEIDDKKGISTSLSNIGGIFLSQGSFDEAENYYLQSLNLREEIGDNKGIAYSLNNCGDLYRFQNENKKAIDYYRRALLIGKETGIIDLTRRVCRSLVLNYYLVDSLEEANFMANMLMDLRRKDAELNYATLSEQQKEKYFSTMSSDFDLYYDFSIINPVFISNADVSYNSALKSKGLLLKSSTAMRNAIVESRDSILIYSYFDWLALKRRIAKEYSDGLDASELEEKANNLEKELVKKSQEFSEIKKVEQLTWQDVQSGLNDGESAIEFIRFTHQEDYRNDSDKVQLYAALIINKNSEHPKMVRLFEEPELEKILGTFPGNNLSYIEQVYGTKENTKSQLYDLIWKPMEEELKGAKKVYVSPVGLLHKTSFAALAKEQDVYLCDLYDVEMKSSTGKIAMDDSENDLASNTTTTLFGGIDYNSDSTTTEIWNYLDGSLSETQQIEKILKKGNRNYNYYNQANATEAQFKEIASKSNILHIATHGFFYQDPDLVKEDLIDETESKEDLVFRGGRTGMGMNTFVKSRNPLMRSGLAFAGANDVWNRTDIEGEDGVLTAAEVATIDMRNTELVVLSACETGLGDIKGSEGVYGLQRSFKMAGVNYLIMSLWQVPDKETAEFMTTFYKHLTKTNDIKESFNLTQKAMRKKYDPYYWAAFVLVE